MARIIYYAFPSGRVQGGIKMTFRHVETLRELGFDAYFSTNSEAQMPAWLDHSAPVVRNMPVQRDDILVLPEDATNAMARAASRRPGSKTVILTQNQLILSGLATEALDAFAQAHPLVFMTVGRLQTEFMRRAFPQATIETVPCFADERFFVPRAKTPAIAYVPKKRAFEPKVIRGMLRRLHPEHDGRPWVELTNRPEAEVAATFGTSDLYLSLSRFESVGMATLEAMACGCVCAGFTGMAGPEQEYATSANGFWAPEDDCEAAAHALASAADLVLTGGPALSALREAGRETAGAWSFAKFRAELETVWMRLAPEARLRNGPLDPA